MARFELTYDKVFAALSRARVRYLVVGGVAMGLHGYARMTADLDLFIDLSPLNTRRALAILKKLGVRPMNPVDPAEFAKSTVRRRWIREKGMVAFPWYHPKQASFRLDMFVAEPIPFSKAWKRRVTREEGGLKVPVVGIDDLLAMKRQANRDKDRNDILVLESWLRERSE